MISARSPLLLLFLLPLGLVFGGCPHHVETMIAESLPPENYEPNYLRSTIPFESLLEQYRQAVETGAFDDRVDTLAGNGEVGEPIRGTRVGPIAMDVRAVDASGYPDRIELQAYVFDTTGAYISGLAPPHLEDAGRVHEYWHRLIDSCGGVATEIEEFVVEEVSEANRTPYSIAFLLDHSGSMGYQRTSNLRRAVGLLLKGIDRRDQVSVISFADKPRREVALTSSKKEWVEYFDTSSVGKMGGGTALYDAVVAGVNQVSRGPDTNRKVVVLFSDGGDYNSKRTLEEAYRHARSKNVAIYTIAYGPADREVLGNLAEYSGGRMYRIYRGREFLDVFIDLYRRLNRYYRITYRAPECAGLHTVRADLSIPELGITGLFGEGVYDRSILTPFDSVGSIVFVNIEFATDEAIVQDVSLPRIEEVVEVMRREESMRLEIRGHTDDRGSDEYNLDLSERRAEAVADLLVDRGIARSRLRVKGFGESRPLVPNDSDDNRRRNRRTEFVVIAR